MTGAGAGAAKKMHAAPHHWQTKAVLHESFYLYFFMLQTNLINGVDYFSIIEFAFKDTQ